MQDDRDFANLTWLFNCDNRNRGILRQNFNEAALLWRAIRMTGGPILEVGRRFGGSTVLLLEASGDRPIVSIDIAPAHHPDCDRILTEVAERDPRRLRLLIANSRVSLSPPERFGFLFIDGDHSYEGVAADTHAHWSALQGFDGKPPYALFHDAVPNDGYAWQKKNRPNHAEGVKRFCEEIINAGAAKVIETAGSSVLVEKLAELPPRQA